jgi:hypothetical protein
MTKLTLGLPSNEAISLNAEPQTTNPSVAPSIPAHCALPASGKAILTTAQRSDKVVCRFANPS